MSNNKSDAVTVEMESMKALMPESGTKNHFPVGSREERVGGEAWHGSVAVITTPDDNRTDRGSPFKQVVCALFGNMGTINTGMMYGFSAVTIPQLLQKDSFIKIDLDQASWIASLPSIGTPIGCLVSGYLLDSIGRKRTLITTLIPMIIGWFLVSAASNVYMIYLGRVLVGLGSGLIGAPARVYTAEVTQPHLRGMLAAVASVGVSLGVTIEYIIGSFLSWNWLALISGMIPTVALISSFFLPESPSWLLSRGRTEEGRAALKRLRGATCNVEVELKALIDFSQRYYQNSAKKSSFKETFAAIIHPSAIKPFFILSTYFLIYQFSGVNPVTFYAVEIFQDSGAEMNKYLATILLGLIRLGSTVVSCIMMRRCGRRPMTFISSVFCGVAMMLLCDYMCKGIQWKEEGMIPFPYSWSTVFNIVIFIGVFCGVAMMLLGGYMFKGIQWKEEGMIPIPYSWSTVFNIFIFTGVFCGVAMMLLGGYMFKGIEWKEEGVTPLPYSWFPVFNIFLFTAASTIGYLVVPWVMIGELYPVKVRGVMGGLTTFCGHFCVFIVVKTFPFLQRTLTKPGTFWCYGIVSLLGTIFFFVMLPETKGRTLQEIEDYFSGRTKTLKPPKTENKSNIVKS